MPRWISLSYSQVCFNISVSPIKYEDVHSLHNVWRYCLMGKSPNSWDETDINIIADNRLKGLNRVMKRGLMAGYILLAKFCLFRKSDAERGGKRMTEGSESGARRGDARETNGATISDDVEEVIISSTSTSPFLVSVSTTTLISLASTLPIPTLSSCGALNVDPFRSVSHCGGGTSLSSSFFKQWYVLTMFILVLTCTRVLQVFEADQYKQLVGEAVKRETRLKQEVTCLEGESDGLKEDKLELQAKVKELECSDNKHATELASLKKEHESGHCD
ncbi:hypothetical protein GOBAR_AA05748 [Gossypium barbadense]|uniref:Uncharacterized protein n=1 Tax=Gossypium barbadense TaxID=3634 RepID=A0A2P5YGX4_GOSBA|nr:hypothetical protein GOBAR_AA05748 [Gossypium barbadense]